MKQIYLIVLVVGILFSTAAGQVGVNAEGDQPDPSAMLDVKSPVKGFLPPRVSLTAINVADPIVLPAVGLLVYNTAISGTPPNRVVPGNYYWGGTCWIPVSPPQGVNPGDMLYWNGTQYVGIPAGFPGQFLQMSSLNIPTWMGATFAMVTTTSAYSITANSAISGGNVTSDGGATVTSKGICYSVSSNPTTMNDKVVNVSGGTGSFSANLSALTANTTYFVRAFAINSAGTAYGNEINFTTACAPIATVSVSISPSANPVAPGTLVTFTAAPVNGGGSPSFQWKVNGSNVGTNSPTYSFVPENADIVKCVLTSGLTCTTNNPATSNEVAMVVGSGGITASLQNKTASPGENIAVGLNVTNFSQIGSFFFKIRFNPGVMTFTGVSNTSLGKTFMAAATDSAINVSWFGIPSVDFPDGKLLDLNFTYNGMTASPLDFLGNCEVTQGVSIVYPDYSNGSVSPPQTSTSFVSLPQLSTAVQGQIIDVPLTLTNMPSNTINFTLNLTFNNPRMIFLGVFSALQPVNYSFTGGSISISNLNPLTPTPSINGQFLVLRFTYSGIGPAYINFVGGCQFSNGAAISVGYTNGSVLPAPATANATIGNVSAISPGSVSIPVTFSELPTSIGAVSIKIGYDATKLSFVNALNPFGADIGLNGNVLTIAWFSIIPANINDTPFVTLNFNYVATGNGTASVTFRDGCEVASGTTFEVIPVNWNHGGVN